MPTKPEYKKPGYLPTSTRSSERPNSRFYASAWWRAQKRAFWNEPTNQYCKGIRGDGSQCMKPRGPYFQVDHVKPLPHGLDFAQFMELSQLEDLQALCGACHARKTNKERKQKK